MTRDTPRGEVPTRHVELVDTEVRAENAQSTERSDGKVCHRNLSRIRPLACMRVEAVLRAT